MSGKRSGKEVAKKRQRSGKEDKRNETGKPAHRSCCGFAE
jgi:hypothetical protein